jgi:hypothetical protein
VLPPLAAAIQPPAVAVPSARFASSEHFESLLSRGESSIREWALQRRSAVPFVRLNVVNINSIEPALHVSIPVGAPRDDDVSIDNA